MSGRDSRQSHALSQITEAITRSRAAIALLIVGSGAKGEMDELSDLDLIMVVGSGSFSSAWPARHDLSRGAVWSDDSAETKTEGPGVHKWLTSDLVLIELLVGEPGQFRLAEPFRVIWGDARVVDRLPRRPPIDPARDMGAEPLAVVRAYDFLKDAVRRSRDV